MKITLEKINKGLNELGLLDSSTRNNLLSLAQITQPSTQRQYEIITGAHTIIELQEKIDARLESDS